MLLWTFTDKSLCGLNVFISLGYKPRSGITGSYGNSMCNHLRNCQTVFQSGCTILHPSSSVWGFQFLHILTNTCFYVFFIMAIPVGKKWYLIVIWVCTSLSANDIEHLWWSSIYLFFFCHLCSLLFVAFLIFKKPLHNPKSQRFYAYVFS